MKKISLVTFLVVLFHFGFAQKTTKVAKVATKTQQIKVKESSLHWLGKKITGQHEGNINLSSGSLTINGKKLISGSFVIDMKSITATDISDAEMNKKFIGHITTGDFFEVDKYPTALFTIVKVQPKKGNEATISGNLTIRGITKPVTFPATVTIENETIIANATIPVNRTAYGIKYGSKSFFASIGDKAIEDVFTLDVKLTAGK